MEALTKTSDLRVLRDFKNGNLDVLVATDVAARGTGYFWCDSHVYNYDIPQDRNWCMLVVQVVLGSRVNRLLS